MEGYTVSGSRADCKSVVFDSGGSTPSPSTKRITRDNAVVAAKPHELGVAGSNPAPVTNFIW